MQRFAIVISRYNTEVTDGLLHGARRLLAEKGVELTDSDIIPAPGAFEIPLIAQTVAETGRYDGVICLGCVIKGDTAHFEFISLGATIGILQSMLSTRVPISFGVLTTYTEEQALARSREDAENKGREAARACYESAHTLTKVRATAIRS
jgi:6,7-dimethyl-8-ribityllumazine synthase